MYSDIEEYDDTSFVEGDLVVFTGRMHSPDFVYVEQFDDRPEYGVVIGRAGGPYSNVLYRVYWFNHERVIETVGGHMRLAYVIEKEMP